MRLEYPFSAVVGQDDLKLALLLCAVDPSIGGVLIKGERGTAKTTIARGLAALLPAQPGGGAAPFIELPLGATEDRVVGSLDLTRALREGQTRLRSGVLARADGGVLYVDEVNLLPDHLVDLLLDAAASGWVTVERDGISAGEAARFVLIGTMNPEEGELRPQFLDRFGLSVHVRGLETQELRMAAISQRLEFDTDPAAVLATSRIAEDSLRRAILEARARLSSLVITREHLATVTSICSEKRLDGIRGDLAVIKTSRALAAWESASGITAQHIRQAAELALPHRLRGRPASQAVARESTTAQVVTPSGAIAGRPPTGAVTERPVAGAISEHAAAGSSSEVVPPNAAPASSSGGAPIPTFGSVSLLTDLIDREGSGRRGSGAGSRRATRATPFDGTGTLAVSETLAVAAVNGKRVGKEGVVLSRADLMQHESNGPGRSNVLFLVDASASMATQQRLELAKAAALGLLQSSYENRDHVALMVFRGEGTDLLVPFTNDIHGVEQAVGNIPSGGRTPLAAALLDATELLRSRKRSLLVVFTDGRANVSVGNGDPWEESLSACGPLLEACAGALVVDCEAGPILLGRARRLAAKLQAECLPLAALEAAELAVRIQSRLDSL
jgi:magnesium chelatase subunit D